MGIEFLFLILAVAVVVFGIAVLVVSRRNAARTAPGPTRPEAPVVPPPQPGSPTLVEAEVVEPELVEPEPIVEAPPASLRDRLAKARSTFTGAFAGVLGRGAINEATFEDLEEALLR